MYPWINIGSLQIPAYGLMMVAGLVLSITVGMFLCRKCYLFPANFFVISVCSVVCALLGAILMFILVTYPIAELWDRLIHARWDHFTVGYVFYGGLLGGVPGFFLGVKLTGANTDSAMRSVVTVIPLGHALGRVGCFLAGCCYGRQYDGFLSVAYPVNDSSENVTRYIQRVPVQLIEAGLLLCLFAVLLTLFLKRKKGYVILLAYAGAYSVLRFLLEFMRGDEKRGRAWIFSTAQWVSVVIFICAAVSVPLIISYKKKHPASKGVKVFDDPDEWEDSGGDAGEED